jgi:hypothetical protein
LHREAREGDHGYRDQTVGIIGAGQMGNGIAHVCALAGLNVRLNDLSLDRVNQGLATINGNLARQVSRGAISDEDRKAALRRITRRRPMRISARATLLSRRRRRTSASSATSCRSSVRRFAPIR